MPLTLIAVIDLTHIIREGVIKKTISYGPVRKRGGGKPPGRNQNRCFFLKREKDAECSETEIYAKIFCDIFAGVFVKKLDILLDIFLKY